MFAVVFDWFTIACFLCLVNSVGLKLCFIITFFLISVFCIEELDEATMGVCASFCIHTRKFERMHTFNSIAQVGQR